MTGSGGGANKKRSSSSEKKREIWHTMMSYGEKKQAALQKKCDYFFWLFRFFSLIVIINIFSIYFLSIYT